MKLKTQALLQTSHKLEWHSTKAKTVPFNSIKPNPISTALHCLKPPITLHQILLTHRVQPPENDNEG